ncbi:MAG: hypothetical protein RMI79_02080 [Nitrososphaerota archaeon]|nr:hypothetical protein [Nitrososphaerota archaeon]
MKQEENKIPIFLSISDYGWLKRILREAEAYLKESKKASYPMKLIYARMSVASSRMIINMLFPPISKYVGYNINEEVSNPIEFRIRSLYDKALEKFDKVQLSEEEALEISDFLYNLSSTIFEQILSKN